jgi:MOSC domain-containing protein YiiM
MAAPSGALLPGRALPLLAARVPAITASLVPGVLGENLSGIGLTEATVCIGAAAPAACR